MLEYSSRIPTDQGIPERRRFGDCQLEDEVPDVAEIASSEVHTENIPLMRYYIEYFMRNSH